MESPLIALAPRRPMFDPLQTTFDLLGRTKNAHVLDLLISGLDVADPAVRTLVGMTLLKRRSMRGNLELIRRLDSLSTELRTEFSLRAIGLDDALRQCLLHGDVPVRLNALQVILWRVDFPLLPTLLQMLEDRSNPVREQVLHTIQGMLEQLDTRLQANAPESDPPPGLVNPGRTRERVIVALEESCQRYPLHLCDTILESLMMLADAEHPAVKKLLRQPTHPARTAAENLLRTGSHPRVLDRVLEFMRYKFPPVKVLQAIRERQDIEFISHLLQNWPKRLTAAEVVNYQQITTLAWLQVDPLRLDLIPPAHQPTLVRMIAQMGLPDEMRRRVLDWMLHEGIPEAKKLAAEALGDEDPREVQEAVIEGLYSEDPQVQTWATHQLRSQGIPQTFQLLIERLDSPLPDVQTAARTELQDFNLKRLMDLFDQISPEVCLSAGRLAEKINPRTLHDLELMLMSPMRSKRIRAARLSVAIGVAERVAGALIQQLDDEDAVVRRTAAEVLGQVSTLEVIRALLRKRDDPSPRVREAVAAALQRAENLASAGPA